MGCGGSKTTGIKNVPEQIHVEPASEQAANPPLANKQQPQGKTTEQPSDENRNQTDDKPQTKEPVGPLTTEQISLVQETWKSVKMALDLQQVGVEFYVR